MAPSTLSLAVDEAPGAAATADFYEWLGVRSWVGCGSGRGDRGQLPCLRPAG